jgi:phosphomevalonate kinase
VKQNYFGDVKACNSNKRELKDCKQTQERINLVIRQMTRISERILPEGSSKNSTKLGSDRPLMSGTATIEEKLAKTSESLSWLLTTIELMTKTNSKQQGILNMLPDKVDSMTMDIKNHAACLKSIEETQDVIREARDELARLQIAPVVQAQPLKTQEQKPSASKLKTKTTTSTPTFLTGTTKTAAKIDQKP